ncbi:polysaccharide deacetylase family protein [Altererythrobacter xixiisoli]|uniref:Chitooligosaccharide deacetylase n=1 Tax=Croceibacterium xixiisoli TaxID=1476466 RepID=A0A6I4TUN7_9SPHN|nr:polysaccharide deacetylase family protein [Croceibacterium xixiisoli]MXO99786.1 polysaccharide deacetylase family protein [Croceibacterium xixiisoli]
MPDRKPFGTKLRDFVNWRLSRHVPVKTMANQLDRAIASFTFDDFPRSALTMGGSILERHGVVGTYYVAGSMADTEANGIEYYRADDLPDLVQRGHEVGDHTFGHLRVTDHARAALMQDEVDNRRFLNGHLPNVIATSFAFPYGLASLRTKHHFSRQFACARGTGFGINHGTLDLSQLRAVSLERDGPDYDLAALLADAKAKRAWIIFYTHDVSANPSAYGSHPDVLERAVTACLEADIEILPVRNALARACFGALG